MLLTRKIFAGILLLAIFFTSCKKETIDQTTVTPVSIDPLSSNQSATTPMWEDFETGSKGAYAAANVTLATGSWNLDDALLGSTASDRKAGSQSIRIRNTGKATMNFNVAFGASTVTVKHAVYGTDGSSTWELRMSTNNGSTFTKVGSTITTSSTTLQTASFTVNVTGNIRFAVVKLSGGTNRINIDDITINPAGSGGGGGAGGGVPGDDDNMLMGNPSDATHDIANFNNYLMVKNFYSMSYSRDRGTPNWVSWHIHTPDIGSTPRQDDFRADDSLPASWYHVQNTSYSGSGFDRGHNCPSADRTASVAANSSTFLMTNMIPQAPNNNQQTWANMENYIRSLVTTGSEVYVIMGSYGVGGTGSAGTANTINNGFVTVPNRIWKVVVVLPNGSGDLARVTTTTRVIAVNTPNINTINSDWKTYRTSVDAIEAATGYNILSNVPASIQSVIEAQVDNL